MNNEENSFQEWLSEHKEELEDAVLDQFLDYHPGKMENPCTETSVTQATPLTTKIFYGIIVVCFVYLVICILTHWI